MSQSWTFSIRMSKVGKKANYAELEEGEELCLMAFVEEHHAKRSDACFVDSGCSSHMFGDKELFIDMINGGQRAVIIP